MHTTKHSRTDFMEDAHVRDDLVNRTLCNEAIRNMQHYLAASSQIFGIAYWVPHADGGLEKVSPIQGFARGVLRSSKLLNFATSLPMDIREMYAGRREIVFTRSIGIVQPFISPVMIESLEEVIEASSHLFHCILSTGDMVKPVSEIIGRSSKACLHVTPNGEAGSVPFSRLSIFDFVGLMKGGAGKIAEPSIKNAFSEFMNAAPKVHAAIATNCPFYEHNIALPNSAVLIALLIRLEGEARIPVNVGRAYEEAVVRSAKEVRLQRKALMSASQYAEVRHDLTLAVDSMIWGFRKSAFIESLRRSGLTRIQIRTITSALKRNGYASSVTLRSSQDSDGAVEALKSSAAQAIIQERSAELRCFTAGLTLLASGTMSPTIRLNPKLNSVHGDIVQIAACARGNGPHSRFKLMRLVRRLSMSMSSSIGDVVGDAVRGQAPSLGSVNIVGDIPIEWLHVDDVPLGVRCDASRVPATPGNVMLHHSSRAQRYLLGLSDFQEVLIVRSFNADDPIARDLERAVTMPAWRQSGDPMPNIRIEDVATVEEFVAVANSFKGAILVFDGHGVTDSQTGVGSIVIGGVPVDVWGLKERLNLPPIVLLSACDTLPVDGSHGSTAVGMLSLGAITVLGTLLPVSSKQSAIFVARLIYRIANYLPVAVKGRRLGVDWRQIMSGMLRMSYASEVISQFEREFGLEFLTELRTKANMDINGRSEFWFESLLHELAQCVGVSDEKVWDWYRNRLEFPDSLIYVQLGRPELISVHEVSPGEAIAAPRT